jgi:hypothetical protein
MPDWVIIVIILGLFLVVGSGAIAIGIQWLVDKFKRK